MHFTRESDIERLKKLPKEKLIDLLLLHIRDIWTEDGLYFLGIEKRFGTDAAVEIDKEVWAELGKIEARRLKRSLDIYDDGLAGLFKVLKHTDWWLDLEDKDFDVSENKGVFRNKNCYVQKTRVKKGFGEFGCKPVRWGFLRNFVSEFNPNIEVKCNFCPPDLHPEDTFCEWEFSIK